MKSTDKELILKITKLCLDSTCDTFHPNMELSSHVKSLTVNVYINGWDGKDPVRLHSYYTHIAIGNETLQSVHDDLVKLIKAHEFNYSPEQLKKSEAKKKAARIAELKNELDGLENNHV